MSEAHIVVAVWLVAAVVATALLARMASRLAPHRPAPPRLVPPIDHDRSHG